MTGNHLALRDMVVPASAQIRDAMEAIDRGRRQIALVLDADERLIATITDGDIRRGLIRGVGMDAPVLEIMQTRFTALGQNEDRSTALRLMKERGLHQIPIIDDDGRLVDLATLDDEPGLARQDTKVILMAGGKGMRLRPLTENLPKPMLPVGGRPILELILENLMKQGFRDFTITLNYKGDVIQEHFGRGERIGARIEYIEEPTYMGTAGALSLLKERPAKPFIVMNGDLLTAIPFDALIRFHQETGTLGTICARDYRMQVPFGVVEVEDVRLCRIVEKPSYSYFVNAGIYVLSPEALNHVNSGEFLDMPTLFERLLSQSRGAAVFPMQEYWVDIGRPEDLAQVRSEFDAVFDDEGS